MEPSVMERVKCGHCERLVFRTARCVCGANLVAVQATDVDRVRNAKIFLDKAVSDIIYEWFTAYYKSTPTLPEAHVELMKKFGFGYDGEAE